MECDSRCPVRYKWRVVILLSSCAYTQSIISKAYLSHANQASAGNLTRSMSMHIFWLRAAYLCDHVCQICYDVSLSQVSP